MIKNPKAAFAGFGEVNTPRDIIIRKCDAAASNLISCGVSLQTVYPITDDPDGNDIKNAVDRLKSCDFDVLVL